MKNLTKKGVEGLIPYPPGKPIEELERELGITNSIKLASNENPLGPSPLAVAAIEKHVRGIHRYPDGSGYYLKDKLAKKFNLSENQIVVGNGSNELIELIIRAFLMPGEGVIQPFPTFLVYEKIVAGADGKMTSVPLSQMSIDLESILKNIRPETKIIFVNNPNNPTGSALLKEELVRFLEAVPKDILVVIDEAYIEFVTDRKVARGLDLMEDYPMVIVLRTFSKLYGLAGLRIGYGFSNEKVVDYMNRVRQPFNVNTLAQVAATAALDDEAFVNRTLKLVREGLEYLYGQLDEMGLDTVRTHTNFFLIKVPVKAKQVYNLMLKEGVIVRAMDSYGLPDYIRINVGLPEENERFILTLKEILHDG